MFNSNKADDVLADNIDVRIAKFANQLQSKLVYRVPPKYFYDLRKINFSVKINLKIRCRNQKIV